MSKYGPALTKWLSGRLEDEVPSYQHKSAEIHSVTINPIIDKTIKETNHHYLLYVLCAANKYVHKVSGKTLIVPGLRHHDIIMNALLDEMNIENNDWEVTSGFLNSRGNFMDRKEAMILAKQCNQVTNRLHGDEITLFSENIY